MLDALSMFSDELTEAILEEKVTPGLDHGRDPQGDHRPPDRAGHDGLGLQEQGRAAAARRGRRLPAEPERHHQQRRRPRQGRGEGHARRATPSKPLVTLAFKLEDGRYGQLTTCASTRARSPRAATSPTRRTGKRHKVGRLVRMHSDEMEEIDERRRGRHRRDVRHRLRLGRHVHRRQAQRRDDVDARARAGHQPHGHAEGQQGSDQHVARRCAASRRKTRPSASAPIPRVARRSSAAWASCTSTCTSSG